MSRASVTNSARARVGTAAPIADAGPISSTSVPPWSPWIGSGSYDPLGETLTYQWQQINGPTVTINNATAAKATFTASAGNSYGFRLTVTNTDGLKGTAKHRGQHAGGHSGTSLSSSPTRHPSSQVRAARCSGSRRT